MDTKVIESLVPITSRPYLREYLRIEKVETDKELLAIILPLIPYDERADLVYDSFLSVNSDEVNVIHNFIIEHVNILLKITAGLDNVTNFVDRFIVNKNTIDMLNVLSQGGIMLNESIPSIASKYEESKADFSELIKFYEDDVMPIYIAYLQHRNK